MRRISVIAYLLVICGVSAQAAAPFDTAKIHRTYLDGDFETAIEMIEDAQNYGGAFSHQDSIFIFKHLGVMHAAKYETREQGKHYMLELLNVEPTAKIMDMYASDMIYMIFKNIQDEYDAKHGRLARPKSGENQPESESIKPPKAKSYAWIGWTAGAVAAAGGIAIALHMVGEEDAKKVDEVSTNE